MIWIILNLLLILSDRHLVLVNPKHGRDVVSLPDRVQPVVSVCVDRNLVVAVPSVLDLRVDKSHCTDVYRSSPANPQDRDIPRRFTTSSSWTN
jgi:hypothetical protein